MSEDELTGHEDPADGFDEDDATTVAVDPDATVELTDPRLVEVLEHGEIEVLGAMPWSSNHILLVRLTLDDDHCHAVYKPERGERPLWDFPPGLWKREVAAHRLAALLDWPVVPPTIPRHDGPLGAGSYQAFVRARFEEHYFTLLESGRYHDQFRRMAVFDLLANNTDRKGGHCLVDEFEHIWGIDNGLCFATEFKLRTVIWDFAGEPLDDAHRDAVQTVLSADLEQVFDGLLTADECRALRIRAGSLAELGRFPHDPTGRRYPWPLV